MVQIIYLLLNVLGSLRGVETLERPIDCTTLITKSLSVTG